MTRRSLTEAAGHSAQVLKRAVTPDPLGTHPRQHLEHVVCPEDALAHCQNPMLHIVPFVADWHSLPALSSIGVFRGSPMPKTSVFRNQEQQYGRNGRDSKW
jgi:hypothetical protein